MKDLRAIVSDKPYFILTTNADEHLEAAGFSSEKVWEIEGTFRHVADGKTPENKQAELNAFLNRYGKKNLVILELGNHYADPIPLPHLDKAGTALYS